MLSKTRSATKRKGAARAKAAGALQGLDRPRKATFPIVGIGASAGGFEAFVQLLKALPPDTGMAFVLVVHLEPEHKSMLATLLGGVTRMPVAEARNGLKVEPNRVYVIPPKADLSIHNGVLQVALRRQTEGRYLPVDHFLSSLAEDRPGSALGVILSGTASDGSVGLKAIKASGGITFAQDEASSEHFGMPGSAIATGCVDLVLPPRGIARELERLAGHTYIRPPHVSQPAELPAVGESGFHKILYLLHSATGVDFKDYKPGTIHRRIARRMALRKIEGMAKYVRVLQSDRAEIDTLFQDILIHVTHFFREPEAFKVLQTYVFPKILAGKKSGEPIRVWVPGCSSGEEVYSLAIVLLEVLRSRAGAPPIQIFGTDISDPSIEKARQGMYGESSLREVSAARLRRFFTRTEGGYRVNKSLRESCIFARQDLTRDPPFSRMDLISCRNVLIYLGVPLQKGIVAGFHYALKENGYLLLGKSESLTGYPGLFTLVDRRAHVYTKKTTGGQRTPEFSHVRTERVLSPLPPEEPVFDALKEADRLVWQRFAHAGLVLNDDLEILHFRGETSPYLAPAFGRASLQALRMVKEELRMPLRAAVHRARRTNTSVRSSGLQVKHNRASRMVNLEVEPLTRPGSKERYFLVLFEEPGAEVLLPRQEQGAARPERRARDREVKQLRRELDASREYVQSVVEKQEAANEELKAANEEILSSNEELQSTNEELETAKEELQSSNEELVTLSETLQVRNTELSQLTGDLNNVLAGANIPILIVGDDGRIRRFTPAAEGLLNLLPSDVGRPLRNIRSNVKIGDLGALIEQVTRTSAPIEREVQDNDDRWYSFRIQPYRNTDNEIDGVLMAFVDIDALKRVEKVLTEREAMVSGLVETLVPAILVVDGAGKIMLANAAVDTMFGYRRAELVGQEINLLVPARLGERSSTSFAAPLVSEKRELLCRRKGGGEFPAEVSLTTARSSGAVVTVASILDLTGQKKTEAALAEKESALRLSQQQLQDLTASLLTAQEEEREHLARELHDDLNQRLAAVAMKAGVLEQQLPANSRKVRDQVRGVRAMVDELTDDVRRIAHQLHPSILDHFGLAKSLRAYCAEFEKLRSLRIGFRQRNLPGAIPPEGSLCLYRVAQEALANVAQHSGAKTASVVLAGAASGIHLVVSDDGSGFDAAAALQQPGLGLTSIRERLRLAGGTLTIKAKPGGGTRIEARIPLPRERR